MKRRTFLRTLATLCILPKIPVKAEPCGVRFFVPDPKRVYWRQTQRQFYRLSDDYQEAMVKLYDSHREEVEQLRHAT